MITALAIACWAPLIAWALLERSRRKDAEGYAKFWEEATGKANDWRFAKMGELRALQQKYDALAAEQNHTKRRAIAAERKPRP